MGRDSITRSAVAIGVATAAYGVSYRVLAVAAGLAGPQTRAMSLLVFTGASQFAVVGVLASGGSVAAALAPALPPAARNGRVRPLARLDPAWPTGVAVAALIAVALVPVAPAGVPVLAAVLG